MYSLAVQSFGKEYELKRAIFAILSFFTKTSKQQRQTSVFLFTDKQEYFKPFLEGLNVHYVHLSPEKIKLMRGDIDFLHRMKIALIEEAMTISQNDLLYFDSDTFFIDDPTPLMLQLSPNKSFMHIHEYEIEAMKDFPLPGGASFQAYYNHIVANSFKLSDGTDFKISPKLSSWNAGVMMLHKSHLNWLPDVYALTEQTYPFTQNHASEQYAFSIILETRTALKTCDSVNYHYWYRIKKQIMDEFLDNQLTQAFAVKTLDEKLVIVSNWTNMMPQYFDQHVFALRDNAVQSFNENQFAKGYQWAAKAIVKKPFGDVKFLRDVLYHAKRQLTNKNNG